MLLKHIIIPIIILALIIVGILVFQTYMNHPQSLSTTPITSSTIRYIALGDSYSNGEGVGEESSWPRLLTADLRDQNIDIVLTHNFARSGWTSGDVRRGQLPAFEAAAPDFATLLIGANDAFQGMPLAEFQENIVAILDRLRAVIPANNRLLVVTAPDYTVSPDGVENSWRPDHAIEEYNAIVTAEATKRSIAVVDLFTLSQTLGREADMFAPDGLHPSRKQLIQWEKVILEKALILLQ